MNSIKAISNIFKFLIYLSILSLGLIQVLASNLFGLEWAMTIKEALHRYISLSFFSYGDQAFIWGVVLLLVILVSFINLFAPPYDTRRYISIEDDNGYIHLSVDAIREYVKRIALEQKDVMDARGKVIYNNGYINISIHLGVSSKQSITGVVAVLKEEVKKKLVDVCGLTLESIQSVEIVVDSIDKQRQSAGANRLVSDERGAEAKAPYSTDRRDMTRIR